VTKAIATPLPRLSGMTGELARENALRNPKRTARTGGALMVGVAMVVGITVIAANARAWSRDIFGEQFTGDYVVSTNTFGFGGLSPQLAADLNQIPEVAVATGIQVGAARDVDAADDTRYIAVDPATAGDVFDIGVVEGSVSALTADGILVEDGKASSRGLGMGDVVRFEFLNGVTRELVVQGIYTEDELAGSYVVSQAVHAQSGSDQLDISVYIKLAPGVSAADARAAISALAEPYANADVESRSEYIDSQAKQVDQIVNLMYGLLALAILIALLSITNSVALSIHERTRELGLLRAVGMTRRQVRIAVKWEAVLIGLLGTLIGLLIGATFGWAISVTLRNAGLGTFAMPVQSLAVISAMAVLGALLASARPARRGAKLDVLRAIATE
jgi:putative ABC transport system permease protein